MKIKKFYFLFATLFLLSNCAQPPTNQVNNQPTSIIPVSTSIKPTSYILPTLTPPPTSTERSTPSATAVVILPTTESPTAGNNLTSRLSAPPYLVYVKKLNGKEQVVLVNQDGSGIKTIPLPDNGFNAGNPSPTGEWIVFYTGSSGEQTLTNGPKYDLALNLMHLPDGAIHEVTDLLSKDFPNNLEKFAELAKSNDQDIASLDTSTIVDEARQGLIYRLMISQWSPSGETLAFAGEMDGPSTDLYLHNLKSSSIKRLSSGSRNIDFIDWFPGGNQILYGSSYLPCEGDCSTYYVTNLDGSTSREIKNFDTFGGDTSFENWSGNSLLTMYTRSNGTGTCCLRNLDFEKNKLYILYGGSFENYAFDPQTNLLAISIADNLENIEPGIYFVNKDGLKKVEEAGLVYYLGWKDYPFIISANGMKLLSESGTSKTLTEEDLIPFTSRNNQYLAMCDFDWSQTSNGLKIFDNSRNLVLEIKDKKITSVTWRIDSQGLFYVANNQLYYVGLQDKSPILVDSHLNDSEFDTNNISFSWIR